MNQLQNRQWTEFQIEAEVDHFGVSRIVSEQNRLLRLCEDQRRLLAAVIVPEFSDIRCEDVNGRNWFDLRDACA